MLIHFGDRLRRARKALGMTQEKFAEGLGIKRGGMTISDWERDKYPPSSSALQLINQRYSINLQWLIDGVGDMFNKNQPLEAHSTVQDYIAPRDDFQDLLKKTGEVLMSNSIYKTALASNINAFHQSILMDRELSTISARMQLQEQQLHAVIKRIDGHPPNVGTVEDDRIGQLERKISDLEKECDNLKKALAAEQEVDGSCPAPPLKATAKASVPQ